MARIGDVMTLRVVAVRPEELVQVAIARMLEENVGSVAVCDGEQLVGIFTERDLLRRVLAAGRPLTLPVAQCMTPNPVVVHPKDSISMAIRRMEEGGYRHLPVVVDGKPTGILSVKRIVHYLVEHFEATVFNLPPAAPALVKREGA
jgi:CBS domain-containing protein